MHRRSRFDGNISARDYLNVHVVTYKKPHADRRACLGDINLYTALSAVPFNRRRVNVELMTTTVTENSLRFAAPNETEQSDN